MRSSKSEETVGMTAAKETETMPFKTKYLTRRAPMRVGEALETAKTELVSLTARQTRAVKVAATAWIVLSVTPTEAGPHVALAEKRTLGRVAFLLKGSTRANLSTGEMDAVLPVIRQRAEVFETC